MLVFSKSKFFLDLLMLFFSMAIVALIFDLGLLGIEPIQWLKNIIH